MVELGFYPKICPVEGYRAKYLRSNSRRFILLMWAMTQAGDEAYVLIDYEHAGVANQTARFAPLDHWPVECKAPGAVYTPAADVYSVGWVMRRSGLALDAEALAFCNQLIGPATARPSAADALQLPRLAGL